LSTACDARINVRSATATVTMIALHWSAIVPRSVPAVARWTVATP
jgi:hypothetical protein